MNTARFYLAWIWSSNGSISFWRILNLELAATELWNGTSWTSNPTGLATARSGMEQELKL
jgi:hypothetical protein